MEKKEFRLSIVIPTYNNPDYFIKALQSVLKQNKQPYEIIITDDSTTDVIKRICSQIGNSLIRYYHNIPSLGAINNWNSGISKTNGNWILVLHHDEELETESYIESLEHVSDNSDIIISEIKVRSNNGKRKRRIRGFLKTIFLRYPALNIILNSIGPCACITVKKEIVESFDNNLTWLVDTEWYYRLISKAKRLKYLDNNYIISNHGHDDQITNNINIKEKEKIDIAIINKKHNHTLNIRIALFIKKIISSFKK